MNQFIINHVEHMVAGDVNIHIGQWNGKAGQAGHQEAEEAGMPVARYAYYKTLSDEHNISLNKIKDKTLDEVNDYVNDLDDKKEDKKTRSPRRPILRHRSMR